MIWFRYAWVLVFVIDNIWYINTDLTSNIKKVIKTNNIIITIKWRTDCSNYCFLLCVRSFSLCCSAAPIKIWAGCQNIPEVLCQPSLNSLRTYSYFICTYLFPPNKLWNSSWQPFLFHSLYILYYYSNWPSPKVTGNSFRIFA